MGERLAPRSPVYLAAENGVPERCLRFPQRALPGVKLPARLLVEGSAGSRVVGAVRVPGGGDETAVQAAAGLCEEIEPGSAGRISFPAHVSKASWRDSAGDLGRWTVLKLLAAVLVGLASLGGAVVAFLGSHLAAGFPIAVLCVAALGYSFKIVLDARDALRIDCG
jgi:hypothetical protein